MKTRKKTAVSTVELHNVSIPIHERTDTKNGQSYSGFWFAFVKDGKRVQIRRATLAEAEQAARDTIRGMVAGRSSAFTVTPEEHAELATALSALRKHPGVSLSAAIHEWAEARAILGAGSIAAACKAYRDQTEKQNGITAETVPNVVSSFIAELEKQDASTRYIQDCKSRMDRISASFRGYIHTVSEEEIKAWINKGKWAPRTRKNFRTAFVTLWKYAKSKKHLPRDRQTEAELVTLRGKLKASRVAAPIGIYSSTSIAKILHSAPKPLLPVFAIGAFAGLRQAELHRLQWKDIKTDHIVIQAENAKTASRRIVPILPTLAAWLRTIKRGEPGERICPQYSHENALARAMTATIRAAGVEPVHNGLRHSFCSYRLAATHSADKVALEAGNSPRMLFTNYRELVTEAEAAQWFAVAPAKRGKIVAMPKQAAA
jgi:integrase